MSGLPEFHSGITIDLLVYSIIIPVIPFQLQNLGYSGVSALVGWLLFAFVRLFAARIFRKDRSSMV